MVISENKLVALIKKAINEAYDKSCMQISLDYLKDKIQYTDFNDLKKKGYQHLARQILTRQGILSPGMKLSDVPFDEVKRVYSLMNFDPLSNLIYINNGTRVPVKRKKTNTEVETVDTNAKNTEIKEKQKSMIDNPDGGEWRPVVNSGRYTADIDGILEVREDGLVRARNRKGEIFYPEFYYPDMKRGVQVHISDKTTPSLRGIVFDAFKDKIEWRYNSKSLPLTKVFIGFKDGNDINCSVDNLYITPKSITLR